MAETQSTTKVFIADDYPVVLVGLRKVLERDGGFEVVGEARKGPEVLPLVGRAVPDVVLLDVDMPGLDGLTCLDRLQARHPEIKVVMLAPELDQEVLEDALARGASGFIVMNVEVGDLGPAIRSALDGSAYRAFGLPSLTDRSVAVEAGLSKREFDILEAVGRGLSNREIATELWITEPTVKFHLTSVYRKLGVANRTGAARWAYSNGITQARSMSA
jgi:NarL family two-component system response regulator LiaR